MLSDNRKYYVTGSQAHRVMAGFEQELTLCSTRWEKFSGWDNAASFVSHHLKETGRLPLVRDAKSAGLELSTQQIKIVGDYVGSLTPVFTTGMETYARELAKHHLITELEEGFSNVDTDRGHDQELEAILEFSQRSGIEFELIDVDQEFFYEEGGYMGITPDGVNYNDLLMIEQGLDVKCPRQDTHTKNLHVIKTQDDLLQHYPEYYWQGMTGLAVTTAKVWHWVSYHRLFEPEFMIVHIPIMPVKAHLDLLLERSQRVIERSKEILEDIRSRYLINK